MNYRLLKPHQIEKSKWDSAIANSCSPRVYACSWYLDVVSPGWEALVMGDYERVMPLPVKQRWGFRYVVQPQFSQQLGLFAPTPPSTHTLNEALDAIPYRYIRLCLNSSNPIVGAKPRINLTLPLLSSHDQLRSLYNANARRNLKKALSAGVTVEECGDVARYVELLHTGNGYAAAHPSPLVAPLIDAARRHNAATLLLGRNDRGAAVAGCCFIHHAGRASYLFPFTHPQGRKCSAMYAIIDQFIGQQAGTELTLDFEGSAIPSVRQFMEGFGATPEEYYPYCRKPFQFLRSV